MSHKNDDKQQFREETENIFWRVFEKTKEVLRVKTVPSDSAGNDAFARMRVSNPQTLFDSKNIFNDDAIADNLENIPLFYDNVQLSGAGTSTTYQGNKAQQLLNVSNATAGVRVRQTKMRFNYQPGKSQMILMTFNMMGAHSGIIKREGIFDEKNGIFLELNGTDVNIVKRSYGSGVAVDTKIAQRYWNVDKLNGSTDSKIKLDWTKTQILFIDFEWLGVGRVRVGFVVNGIIYYAHEFNNSNVNTEVYMSTPNLPLRSEIRNDGTGIADSISQICSSVISEGGSESLGVTRSASTNGTHLDANVENTVYALLGIRLKSNYIGCTVKLLNYVVQIHTGSHKLEIFMLLNPTVAGSFTYVAEPNSAVEIARGALANTVTGGIKVGQANMAESGGSQGGNSGSASGAVNNALNLGSKIDGTVDTIVLCVRPIGGSSNVDVEGALTWQEIV